MSFVTIFSIVKTILEVSILWAVFYQILVFFEGTRSFQVLKGITLLVVAFLVFQIIRFDTLNWLLTKFFGLSIIAFLIIFQQELRQGLARLGQQHLFNIELEESEIIAIIEEITSAAYKISKNKIGCLIAIERDTKLKTYIESGIPIDGKISSELIQSIFIPRSPMHDGGLITRRDRIIAASCLFPLSDNPNFSKIIGTRHRAALGLTEQTDAIVIMVSEETGEISVAAEGRFIPVVNRDRLVNILKNLLVLEKTK
jgi:diadenylate cyclase